MSKIILFLLGFAVGTLVYRGWQYLSKARKRDLEGKIERGRRKQRRMEQHPKRTHTPSEQRMTCGLIFEDKDGNRYGPYNSFMNIVDVFEISKNGGPE